MNPDTKRYMKIGDLDIEITGKEGEREIFGPENLFSSTGDNRNQEQDQSSLGRPSTNTDKN